jgi:stage III sporulation protein AH
MSMIIGRKQIILAALVLALGAAIFLNWKFTASGNDILANATNSTSTLGNTAYVSAKASTSSKKATTANTASGSDVFAVAKLSREQARGEALDTIKIAADDAKATPEIKKQALADIEAITKNITAENSIETLILAKGFRNCIATISDSNISIVVKPKTDASLSASDVIQIKDIVVNQTKISADKITIIQSK